MTDIFKAEMKKSGQKLSNSLCEHFAFTRQELFEIVKIKGIRSFNDLVASHGKGNGCEICKPAVASILASLWNQNIVEHTTIQDTNDRCLANIQRGGTYSVVPRVPGGEITPEKLVVLGQVAKKYGLWPEDRDVISNFRLAPNDPVLGPFAGWLIVKRVTPVNAPLVASSRS